MEDILGIVTAFAAIGGIVCLVIFLIYAFKCASRKDALLEVYDGFFTPMGAYIYTTLSVMRIAAPVLSIVYPIIEFTSGSADFSPIMILVSLLVGVAISILFTLLKKSRDRQLKETYGPLAAREISKAMIQVGFGTAFGFATMLIGTSAKLLINYKTAYTTSGEKVYVAKYSETQYIDAEGNLYDVERVD
ncbi:MAG: hypothetical protein IJE07_05690 [Clostridia bacterium]|nr:hypothetical protein [Clostridia bacterium]